MLDNRIVRPARRPTNVCKGYGNALGPGTCVKDFLDQIGRRHTFLPAPAIFICNRIVKCRTRTTFEIAVTHLHQEKRLSDITLILDDQIHFVASGNPYAFHRVPAIRLGTVNQRHIGFIVVLVDITLDVATISDRTHIASDTLVSLQCFLHCFGPRLCFIEPERAEEFQRWFRLRHSNNAIRICTSRLNG